MVIVEQSLNVALAFADRAVFMEKGRVRFEGPTQRAGRARRPRTSRVPRRRGRLTGVLGIDDHAAGDLLRRRLRADLRGVRGGLRARLPLHRVSSTSRRARSARSASRSSRCSTCSTAFRTGSRSCSRSSRRALIGMVIELTVVRRLFNSAAARAADRDGRRRRSCCSFLRISLPDIDGGGERSRCRSRARGSRPARCVVLPRDLLVLIVAPIVDPRPRPVHDPDDVRPARCGRRRRTPTRRGSTASASSARRRSCGRSRPRSPALTAILVAPLLGVTPGNIVARRRRRASARRCCSRALVVALIARMRSLPMCIVGGIAVGVVRARSCSPTSTRANQSIVDLYLFVAALVLVLFVHRGTAATTPAGRSRPQVKPIPERLRSLWYVRRLPAIGFVVARSAFLAVAAGLPRRNGRRSSCGPRS